MNMTTLEGLFQEFGATLELPDYFGFNSAAFDECLADLTWLPGDIYVIVIANAEHLLSNSSTEVSWLVDVLDRICEEWADPIAQGEQWNRPAIPFHVIFQYELAHRTVVPNDVAALPEVDLTVR
jgi:RNAse (barnase) inhibitor barstar